MSEIASHVNQVALHHPLGNRVAVMGHGGKTTLAKAIARKLDIEFIELDQIAKLARLGAKTRGRVSANR